jgi:hypothetical protein
MQGPSRRRRGLALLAAAGLVAGCTSAGSAVPSGSGVATASAAAPAPLASGPVPADAACPAPATPMTTWPPVEWPLSTPASEAANPSGTFAADSRKMADELVAAIGNPDTGSKSEAWSAFEATLTTGDAASTRAAAEAILAHLRASCAAIAPHFAAGPAPWVADVRGLLDGTARAVARMRDAGAAGDAAGVQAGRDLLQAVMLDHFYQAFSVGNPSRWETTLRTEPLKATASHVRWHEGDVANAFDGRPETAWEAGGVPAPQWIEVDLGVDTTVVGVRLLVWQETPGATDHRVTVRSADGTETELARFTGETRDSQSLESLAPAALANVRYLRVTTLASAAMIGWREVEVLTPQGSLTGPCPAATTPITGAIREQADPATPSSDPRLAVDGDRDTAWEPPAPGTTKDPGIIRVWYETPFRASAVRLLLGPGAPAFSYTFVLYKPASDEPVTSGVLATQPQADGWITAPVTGSCHTSDSLAILIQSQKTPRPIVEIDVLGAPAR